MKRTYIISIELHFAMFPANRRNDTERKKKKSLICLVCLFTTNWFLKLNCPYSTTFEITTINGTKLYLQWYLMVDGTSGTDGKKNVLLFQIYFYI